MNSGHDRLNDKGTFSIEYNGIQSYAEDLAYNFNTKMVSGINQFYDEKQYWVSGNPTNEVVGHYTSRSNNK